MPGRIAERVLLPLAGASLLAKNVNDNASILKVRGVLGFFAGKPAPTNAQIYHTCRYVRANRHARSINIGAISIAVGVPWRV